MRKICAYYELWGIVPADVQCFRDGIPSFPAGLSQLEMQFLSDLMIQRPNLYLDENCIALRM